MFCLLMKSKNSSGRKTWQTKGSDSSCLQIVGPHSIELTVGLCWMKSQSPCYSLGVSVCVGGGGAG